MPLGCQYLQGDDDDAKPGEKGSNKGVTVVDQVGYNAGKLAVLFMVSQATLSSL